MIEVRPAEPEDGAFVRRTLEESWGGPYVAAHGELIDASSRPGRLASRRAARRLKPSIPHEADGIAIRHELELCLEL
jgi:hypothetical protein